MRWEGPLAHGTEELPPELVDRILPQLEYVLQVPNLHGDTEGCTSAQKIVVQPSARQALTQTGDAVAEPAIALAQEGSREPCGE
eukprot:3493258-Prymnesium_polylepis.1